MHGAFLIFFEESNTFKKTIRSKIPHLCHTPQGEPERQRRQPPKSAGEFQRILCGLTSSPGANSHFLIIRSKSGVLHSGMKWSCFILWNDSGTMLHRQAFMKHGFAVWSGTLCHEAHLRCMKRSLTASCFFAHLGKKMVGAEGIEPSTFCSQSRRAKPLRYAPMQVFLIR